MKTVVPLSGGLDSATVLAGCMASGDQCRALLFSYAQPHGIELDYAKRIAIHYQVSFDLLRLPEMPKINDVIFAGRNLVFASVAVAFAQANDFDRVAFGCNASDWERFPDCRLSFWRLIDDIAATYGIRVLTPLIYLDKRQVVGQARKLGVPIELTWSCYSPIDGKSCGECLACKTRNEALAA